jgi:hypothetical protein
MAIIGFVYGCATSLLSLMWLVLALRGNASDPNPALPAVVALVHGGALLMTFHRNPLEPRRRPLLSITLRRIAAAKVILGVAILNFVICLAATWLAGQEPAIFADGASVSLASLALVSSIYIALHWAFRPENLFSEGFLRTAAFPLWFLFRGRRRN